MENELLHQAIMAIQQGNRDLAFQFLKQALAQNPKNPDAWYWMAQTVEDPIKKQDCLNRCYRLNPEFNSGISTKASAANRSNATELADAVRTLPETQHQPEPKETRQNYGQEIKHKISRLSSQEKSRFRVIITLSFLILICICLMIGGIFWFGFRLGDSSDAEPAIEESPLIEITDEETSIPLIDVTPTVEILGPSDEDLSAELGRDADGFYLVNQGQAIPIKRFGPRDMYHDVLRADSFRSTRSRFPIVLLRSETLLPAWIDELIQVGVGIGVRLEVRNGLLTIYYIDCDNYFNDKGACKRDVRIGDVLLGVNDHPINHDLDTAKKYLQGPLGEDLVLSLLRGTNSIKRNVVRNFLFDGKSFKFNSEIVNGRETSFVRLIPKTPLQPGLYCYLLQYQEKDHACFVVGERVSEQPVFQEIPQSELPDGLAPGLWTISNDEIGESPILIDRYNRFVMGVGGGKLEKIDAKNADLCGSSERWYECYHLEIKEILKPEQVVSAVLSEKPKDGGGNGSPEKAIFVTLHKTIPDTSTGDLSKELVGTWNCGLDQDSAQFLFKENHEYQVIQHDSIYNGNYFWREDQLVLYDTDSDATGDEPSFFVLQIGEVMALYNLSGGQGILCYKEH